MAQPNPKKKSNFKPYFKPRAPQQKPELVSKAYHVTDSPNSNYTGFYLYFPHIDKDMEDIRKRVSIFDLYIQQNESLYSITTIQVQRYFTVDYKSINSNDEKILKDWPNFKDEVVNNTEYCLNCMGLAMHQYIINRLSENLNDTKNDEINKLGIIRARLINVEPILQIKDLRVNFYGKLVSVRGTVIKAANPNIFCQYMAFSCATCTGTQIVKQIDGGFTLPTKCPTNGCRAQSRFNALYNSSLTRTVGRQVIKIQEIIGSESENGRVPRAVECELIEDLTNSCVPGDDITVTGILKAKSTESNSKDRNSSTFELQMDVVSIVNNKNHTMGSYGASERITFNIRDYYAIQKIHGEPQLFRFLVQSLCPSIYGHELVKAGLILGLFGGAKSERIRSESHILMVGDPGLGKSQMLQACSNVAPRGVYVCGNTSTGSGLTVTMTRESGGEYGLEAGALMLADQGCCCIDEFDKMQAQHACLLEAMEQQSISIAKAGTVCTLPTRATILAAANPVGGHYNKGKTIAENLKISSPMLSRFDLIFILLDQPNEEIDMLISDHILGLHSGKNNDDILKNISSTTSNKDLRDRLKLQIGESIDHLPHNLYRKYIAYAQKYVNPQLSDGAKVILENFYMKLRKQFQTGDSTPVTTRQLNSLIRLTQARAKLELREEATEEDAADVVEIMKYSLLDIFTDNFGVMDKTRSQLGTGISTKNQVLKLLKGLQQKSEAEDKSIFTTKEIKEIANDVGVPPGKFMNTLDSLNLQGFILSKGGNKYQLVTVDL